MLPVATVSRTAQLSAVLRATIVPMFYIGSSCSKIVVPFGAIPLNQLQLLRDRNPRGITFGYATRDHCFVIASEGVIKKESRSSLFLLLPLNSSAGLGRHIVADAVDGLYLGKDAVGNLHKDCPVNLLYGGCHCIYCVDGADNYGPVV